MPLTYHPEFAAAAGAALEMRKTLPQPPVGDIEGRCNAVGPIFEQILRSIPPSTGVTRDIYECSGNLGRPTPIHHHYPTDPSKLAGPIGAVIVYVHGGGMYLGSIDWFHHYISRLHAVQLHIDPKRIGIYGESAGGGIAAGTALLARDRGLNPPLAKQIHINPMLDDRNTIEDHSIAALTTWTTADNVTGWGALLGEESGGAEVSPYAAPSRETNLVELPDTYIDVGVVDIFRDESISFASGLIKAEVMVEFHLYPGVPHGFEGMAPETQLTKNAVKNRIIAAQSF
ncbi:arylesterase/monooxygenase [Ilyonectria destructans]|nr:arylesterase/monooxygenase [Ilyonectria destructans]